MFNTRDSSPSQKIPHHQYPRKKKKLRGTWVPSLSTNVTASLSILSPPTLLVSLRDSVYEEHYISKLHFTWPQVSANIVGPVNGSRVIFARYRDSMGQVQKFALRFSSVAESQVFIWSLKEAAKLECSNANLSSQLPQRACDQSVYENPFHECTPCGNLPSSKNMFTRARSKQCSVMPPKILVLLCPIALLPFLKKAARRLIQEYLKQLQNLISTNSSKQEAGQTIHL